LFWGQPKNIIVDYNAADGDADTDADVYAHEDEDEDAVHL